MHDINERNRIGEEFKLNDIVKYSTGRALYKIIKIEFDKFGNRVWIIKHFNGTIYEKNKNDIPFFKKVDMSVLEFNNYLNSLPRNKVEDLEGEIWKDIPNYEGLYRISSKGRIKSINYYNILGNEDVKEINYDQARYGWPPIIFLKDKNRKRTIIKVLSVIKSLFEEADYLELVKQCNELKAECESEIQSTNLLSEEFLKNTLNSNCSYLSKNQVLFLKEYYPSRHFKNFTTCFFNFVEIKLEYAGSQQFNLIIRSDEAAKVRLNNKHCREMDKRNAKYKIVTLLSLNRFEEISKRLINIEDIKDFQIQRGAVIDFMSTSIL